MRFFFASSATAGRHDHATPRVFQFDTTETLTPSILATLVVPPSWSIKLPIAWIIPHYVNFCKPLVT